MTRDLTAGMVTAMTAATVRPIFLAEIQTNGGYVRAWTGQGDLTFDGNTYQGTGNFGGFSTVTETSELQATGLQFFLSGIPSALLATALADIKQGLSAKLYVGALDASDTLIADPYLLFEGVTDVAEIDEGAETSTITISAESRLIDAQRARARRYTHEDQQIDYPGDKGFEYVESLQEKEIRFGN